MPDRRRVAAKAIIAAGAYLHPNFYVGDQDKKLRQIPSDAPITDSTPTSWRVGCGGSTLRWHMRSKTQFSRRSTTRRWRKYSQRTQPERKGPETGGLTA